VVAMEISWPRAISARHIGKIACAGPPDCSETEGMTWRTFKGLFVGAALREPPCSLRSWLVARGAHGGTPLQSGCVDVIQLAPFREYIESPGS
jgi:hypothetical protein